MAGVIFLSPSEEGMARDSSRICIQENEAQCSAHKCYFSAYEIEHLSPSRKDGIDSKTESELRKSYCSFLQEIGMKLKVPQVTIASAIMLCHRFYMYQSHAKNDWQTIATVGIFLACKIEETPRFLNDVVVVAYEMIYKWDPSAAQRIRQREYFDKQKELIVNGERMLLSTIAFDLDIQLPYKPLVTALKRLGLFPNLGKVAWNFVNDWIHTTLCLEYKPHYIAAGSMFLAAKFQKVKLPTVKGNVWWMEFDVSPKQLEESIQKMLRLMGRDKKQDLPCARPSVNHSKVFDGQVKDSSPQSCTSCITISDCHASRGAIEEVIESGKSTIYKCGIKSAKINSCTTDSEVLPSQISDTGSATSFVEDGDPDQNSSSTAITLKRCSKIDINRIREAVKKRRYERAANKKVVEPTSTSSDKDGEAWIERELENGIELEYESSTRKQRKL